MHGENLPSSRPGRRLFFSLQPSKLRRARLGCSSLKHLLPLRTSENCYLFKSILQLSDPEVCLCCSILSSSLFKAVWCRMSMRQSSSNTLLRSMSYSMLLSFLRLQAQPCGRSGSKRTFSSRRSAYLASNLERTFLVPSAETQKLLGHLVRVGLTLAC